jgi:uncharacterized protein (TIGR02996 family)
MTDGDLLLRAVYNDPADDTVRLVYADWLGENGEPEYAALIRAQIQRKDAKTKIRSRQARKWFLPWWVVGRQAVHLSFPKGAVRISPRAGATGRSPQDPLIVVRRGFPHEIATTEEHFVQLAHTYVRQFPTVTGVSLGKLPHRPTPKAAYCWQRLTNFNSDVVGQTYAHLPPWRDATLSAGIFDLLDLGDYKNLLAYYPTAAEALKDLNRACLRYARKSPG